VEQGELLLGILPDAGDPSRIGLFELPRNRGGHLAHRTGHLVEEQRGGPGGEVHAAHRRGLRTGDELLHTEQGNRCGPGVVPSRGSSSRFGFVAAKGGLPTAKAKGWATRTGSGSETEMGWEAAPGPPTG